MLATGALVLAALAGALGQRALGADRRERVLVGATLGMALLCAAYGLLGALAATHPLATGIDPWRPPSPLLVQRPDGPPIAIPRGYLWPPLATPGGACLVLFAAVLVLGAGEAWRRRTGRPPRSLLPPPGAEPRMPAWQRALVGAALGVLALAAVSALGPPRGYDALWYHLPTAVAFLRSGHLGPPSDEIVAFFPGNGEVWLSLVLGLGGGRPERALPLVNLGQLPLALLLALASARLAAASGLARGRALVAAAVLGAPIVVFQSTVANVDLFAAAFLVAAGAFVMRFAGSGAPAYPALAGLAAGVAAGAKYAALPVLAVLGAVLLLATTGRFVPRALREARFGAGRMRLLRAGAALALFGLSLLPASAFWYWRNARLTGNPVFPVSVRLGPLSLAGIAPPSGFNPGKEREFVTRPWQWLWQPFREPYSAESGTGAPLAVLVPLGAALVAAAGARSLRQRGRLPLAAGPLLLGAGAVVLWATGSAREPRHLLPATVLLAPLAAVLLAGGPGTTRRRRPWIVAASLGTLVLVARTALFSGSHELAPVAGKRADAYYGLPAAYARLPAGAVVENRAGPTYNFPLLGPRLDLRVRPFIAGPPPSLAALQYHGVHYLVHRGPPGARFDGLTLVWRHPLAAHRWWDARPGDVLELYRVPPPAPPPPPAEDTPPG